MSAAQEIKIDLQDEGDWQRLVYHGPINEDTKMALARITDKIAKRAILDLGDVSYLNSCGIRDWSYFLRAIKQDREIVLDRCPDEVVRAMNMVISFHANLLVKSVFRIYGCPSCDHEQAEVLLEGVHFRRGTTPNLPRVICKSCGKDSEPFESDEEFFTFLG